MPMSIPISLTLAFWQIQMDKHVGEFILPMMRLLLYKNDTIIMRFYDSIDRIKPSQIG